MKMWTVKIRDQTARSVQFDVDLHCPQKLLVSALVRKELKRFIIQNTFSRPYNNNGQRTAFFMSPHQ